MCREASFVLTKTKTCWSKRTDSHEWIIVDHKLHADGSRGPNIVRVEITPPNEDFSLPLDQWVYRLDQDELPSWYDAAACEARVREVLPEWLASKVVLLGQSRDVRDEIVVAAYGNVTANGDSVVTAYGNSRVTANGSGVVTAYGNSRVTAYDDSRVTANDNSVVTAYDDSVVTANGNSRVTAYDDSVVIRIWQ